MRLKTILAGVLAVVVAAAGCSGTTLYSCSSNGICEEWSAPYALSSAEMLQAQRQCAGTLGTACPDGSRIGVCVFVFVAVIGSTPYGNGAPIVDVLYAPTFNATTGESYCTNYGGVWTSG